MSVEHATFTLERRHAAPPARVFTAWADPVAKAAWFGADEHRLDFRVGGTEFNRGTVSSGAEVTFESLYRDIVVDGRIVYTSTLHLDGTLATVSVTTVELRPDGHGTVLTLTEAGAFLDRLEAPPLREQGTAAWLARLTQHLDDPTTRGPA